MYYYYYKLDYTPMSIYDDESQAWKKVTTMKICSCNIKNVVEIQYSLE